MIRGRSFYAIWDEEAGVWRNEEIYVAILVDKELEQFREQHGVETDSICYLGNYKSKAWIEFQQYLKNMPDHYKDLNSKIMFKGETIKREDYASHTLPYGLGECETPCYDILMGTLYDDAERQKLEWSIGAVLTGDSKRLQKFIVLYGAPRTGKSTFLNILEQLTEGYNTVFEAKAISRGDNQFSLDQFKSNPLVGIQQDGDLSRIEDNTKLNSMVSHEEMLVNEKFKAPYRYRFNTFLFMGTNKPVCITDAKSGILRRLLDVHPTGNRVPADEYDRCYAGIPFELGGIAYHCIQVYKSLGFHYYDHYTPRQMLSESNDIYSFIEDNLDLFLDLDENGLALKPIWMRYKQYCESTNVRYQYSMRVFKMELKEYFQEFRTRHNGEYSVYIGFKKSKFFDEDKDDMPTGVVDEIIAPWLKMDDWDESLGVSELDEVLKDYPAQYATEDGIPSKRWDDVKTKLSDIDPKKLHYVLGPSTLVTVDFDLKDDDGNKNLEANLKAASKWPQTYAELSKSGVGIHLEYWYQGDIDELSEKYAKDVEIKFFKGKSALRRKLTKCNNIPIATIYSGLPLKERRTKVTTIKQVRSEQKLRELIERNLRKEIHDHTKPSMDFIYQLLEDAYNGGMHYDVQDLRPMIQVFALSSNHQSDYCLRLINKMHFHSEDASECVERCVDEDGNDIPIVFFDVEVFPNLFVLCYKKLGKDKAVISLVNPEPAEVEKLLKYRLVGFNNRKYDNHILHGRIMGYTEEELYRLSQRIVVDHDKDAFFREAYSYSYTDIYDFLSAGNKMSLKKWEIRLGIHHQELGLPWNQPVPEELWVKVAEYCCNDVIATEACWNENQGDWDARCILADWSEKTVNDTTNTHTTQLVVGDDKNPQSQFIYTDLSTIYPGYEFNKFGFPEDKYDPGTKIVAGKSYYRGEDPGEGGYVYAEPGMHTNVALLDVESMHPHSAWRLMIFGEEYTMRFVNILQARLAIKHKDYDLARQILPEKLHHYLDDKKKAKALSTALKTAINSVYGLTSAKFENKLRDPRNVDNIVAKYGALFMINLKHEVQDRGFTVVHIKTDSIKIADATPEIIQFVMDYGKQYGFNFDHEDTYSKMCLVNDAVYIARYAEPHVDDDGVEHWWTATGAQFQIPYVFKTLFSKEPLTTRDLIETKSATTALYLDFNESLSDLPFDECGNATPDDHPSRHDYRFVGKVGAFCPVVDGAGGGVLLREGNEEGKFSAVMGTKKKDGSGVYRWMEYEMIMELGKEDQIDMSYYESLARAAIDKISEFGDYEWFASDRTVPLEDTSWMNIPIDADEELPFDPDPKLMAA